MSQLGWSIPQRVEGAAVGAWRADDCADSLAAKRRKNPADRNKAGMLGEQAKRKRRHVGPGSEIVVVCTPERLVRFHSSSGVDLACSNHEAG